MVLETNWIKQPESQLPSSSYNHNTLTILRTSVRELLGCMGVAILKCIHNGSLTDVLIVVSGCKMSWAAASRVALCS